MTEGELVHWALKGNSEAIEFYGLLAGISQTWDDLIDGDGVEITPEVVNAMMWDALVELPNNPFYARHFPRLNTLVQQTILDWLAANELEAGGTADKRVSFILRDSLAGVLVHCAYLTGGYEWANEIAPAVRRYIHDEDFDSYAREHDGQQQ
jgi:hypothetical protein